MTYYRRTIKQLLKSKTSVSEFNKTLNLSNSTIYNLLFNSSNINANPIQSSEKALLDYLEFKIKKSSSCKSFSTELSEINDYLVKIHSEIKNNSEFDSEKKNIHYFSEFLTETLLNGFINKGKSPLDDDYSKWVDTSEYNAYNKLIINLEKDKKQTIENSKYTFYGPEIEKIKKSLCIVSRDFTDMSTSNFLSQIKATKQNVINNLEYHESQKNYGYNDESLFNNLKFKYRRERSNSIEIKDSQEVFLANLDFNNYDAIFFIGHGDNDFMNGGFIINKSYKKTKNTTYPLKVDFICKNIPKSKAVFLFSCSIEPYKKLKSYFKYFGVSENRSSYFEFQEMFFYGFISSILINNNVELSIKAGLLCSEFRTLNDPTIFVSKYNNAEGYKRVEV